VRYKNSTVPFLASYGTEILLERAVNTVNLIVGNTKKLEMYIYVFEYSHCARACPEEKIHSRVTASEREAEASENEAEASEIDAEESACEAEISICDIITKLVTPKCVTSSSLANKTTMGNCTRHH
jgi:hypothetical protein